MTMDIDENGYPSGAGKRPRLLSPAIAAGQVLQKGHAVQFFFESDAGKSDAPLVPAKGGKAAKFGPRLLLSHGWLNGTLAEAFDPAKLNPEQQSTWPLVIPRGDVEFFSREGRPVRASTPRRCLNVRENCNRTPALSIVFMRWGGATSKWMDDQEPNDGDWGKYGSPPSDEYMGHLVKLGIRAHPRLVGEDGLPCFELHHLFVTGSDDCWNLTTTAPQLTAMLRAPKKMAFWMLWPAEWEDTGDPDFACYIQRQAIFGAMRACEAAGLRSGFPHPADQFEHITSKSWMATLSVHPGAHLPACTLVNKSAVKIDAKQAATRALKALHHIRAMNPFPIQPGEPPAPSSVNKDAITKGVVKLGWSWENRFVSTFNGEKQLQERLVEMMTQEGCLASTCVVQEWVDFDFEMRLYFLPPDSWPHPERLEPTQIQCNAWGAPTEKSKLGTSRSSFSKLDEEKVLQRWCQDTDAWAMAKEKAIDISQMLLTYLLAADSNPVPMIRLDFMLKRLGQGQARVVFGEFCEMGACCLGWMEGPPTIWRRAIDAGLR
eukprot:TRINITY_DN64621_c0_g1_i1.p1 TRINITY_DN64621_c0_g1~~TRINITY_DN64621_c0_g1_i1.p1  ORF type:complete len:545 (-),score=111.18 TRINITY_DN64621_c0_g1_i1:86-1720(-)